MSYSARRGGLLRVKAGCPLSYLRPIFDIFYDCSDRASIIYAETSMKTGSNLSPDRKAITQLKQAANNGQLIAIIGTGMSVALTCGKIPALSWKGLIEDGFSYGLTKGRITAAQSTIWKNQLNSDDLDDVLGAAEFMGRKLDAPNGDLYARWLKQVFENVEPNNRDLERAVRALQALGIPLCTLNYDSLLERVTTLQSIELSDRPKVTAWMRREYPGILHLHGSWESPASCILGIRDYATTISDDFRDLIQRALGSFSRLLFIGCGDTFADPNFSALIKWLRAIMKTSAPEHYALVKDMRLQNDTPTQRGKASLIRSVSALNTKTFRDFCSSNSL
jgi:SIR2-like domain